MLSKTMVYTDAEDAVDTIEIGEVIYRDALSDNLFLRIGITKKEMVRTDDFHLTDFVDSTGKSLFSGDTEQLAINKAVWESAELFARVVFGQQARHCWRFISDWEGGTYWRNSAHDLWATVKPAEGKIHIRRHGAKTYTTVITVGVVDGYL